MDCKWWQTGIIYQIYPRSYMDSNNDGIGDLQGIINKLDYIKSLGVKTIWISPMYPSPMKDFGYDVADYTDVHPIFGNLEIFDNLLKETHNRDMKLILDLVPSHTSDQHEWFKESRKDKINPKRDWYIWKDPKPNGDAPNNWIAGFGGSSWEFDKTTNQYYLHSFTIEQPDLNYRNHEVVEAMLGVMEFWLKKGVDGFRVDVICNMIKDGQFRDNPVNPDWNGFFEYDKYSQIYTFDQPGIHEIIKKMRCVIDKFDDRVMIGETYLPYKTMVEYYGDNDECHLPFNFHLLLAKWNAGKIRTLVDEYEKALPDTCWPNYVLGNHDQKRIVTRIGREQARIANMLLMTLRGTSTIYYGEEIGMHNVNIPVELIHDPPAVNNPKIADEIGRDPERTPMQWNCSPNAGFSSKAVKTWLPVADDYQVNNVDTELEDPFSMLSLFKKLIQLRNSEKILQIGKYSSIDINNEDVFAYRRFIDNECCYYIILNFGNKNQTVSISDRNIIGKVAVTTTMLEKDNVNLSSITLEANEGLIIKVTSVL
ncbi:MAG TPA: alpha-amylase family glycosyl hydrolase [Victivallales bacterium]|nr:alpha-amylase family glycosyl hydrolase [Victivallales bacterium]